MNIFLTAEAREFFFSMKCWICSDSCIFLRNFTRFSVIVKPLWNFWDKTSRLLVAEKKIQDNCALPKWGTWARFERKHFKITRRIPCAWCLYEMRGGEWWYPPDVDASTWWKIWNQYSTSLTPPLPAETPSNSFKHSFEIQRVCKYAKFAPPPSYAHQSKVPAGWTIDCHRLQILLTPRVRVLSLSEGVRRSTCWCVGFKWQAT